MKKTASFLLAFLLLISLVHFSCAAEKIVQLTVPGCFSWGANKRIGAILSNVGGIKKYTTQQPNILIIAFDDEKTTLDVIVKALKEGTFPVQGKPVYRSTYPD